MNTTNKLPTKLHRALSAVKNYLDRCPHGVAVEMAIKKVSDLSTLNGKQLEQLLDHLGEREAVHVFRLSPEGSEDLSKGRQYLMLKRFGEPAVPSGYEIWPKREAITPKQSESGPEAFDWKLADPDKPLMPHQKVILDYMLNPPPMVVVHPQADRLRIKSEPLNSRRVDEILEETLTEGEQVGRTTAPVTTVVKTAAQMRKEAEELLRQAEETERNSEQNDFFNKRLGPVKLEILQASNTIRSHLDGLIDGMAALEKAGDKLKELTA